MRFVAVLVLCSGLLSCGFTFRGASPLPSHLDVVIDAEQPFMPLQLSVIERARVYGINTPKTPSAEKGRLSVRLFLETEVPERRLLSVFSTGQVAEYELIYPVRYTVFLPDGTEVRQVFEITRDYQDDPDQALAKSRELDLVLKEMREEAADLILRRLPLLLP